MEATDWWLDFYSHINQPTCDGCLITCLWFCSFSHFAAKTGGAAWGGWSDWTKQANIMCAAGYPSVPDEATLLHWNQNQPHLLVKSIPLISNSGTWVKMYIFKHNQKSKESLSGNRLHTQNIVVIPLVTHYAHHVVRSHSWLPYMAGKLSPNG